MNRLPALPLIVNDPYFSVWLPADTPTQANTVHWSGANKYLRGTICVDGVWYRYLGKNGMRAAICDNVDVTPLTTRFQMTAGCVSLDVRFTTPMLPDDWDLLSAPVTIFDVSVRSLDKNEHAVSVILSVSDQLCYDGESRPEMHADFYTSGDTYTARAGQKHQKILCHSGDRITIDWGYLQAVSKEKITYEDGSINWKYDTISVDEPSAAYVLLGYDDIASVNYYGTPCVAWYRRTGQALSDMMENILDRHDEIIDRCRKLDEQVLSEASAISDDYAKIVSASWRQTFGAHKLIATPPGHPALLSKENDSNGSIGTVDVSYPTLPILLKYCPELVNALSRPVLEFAAMPVWEFDFAPHDLGRYPYVYGQVSSSKFSRANGEIFPCYYLYPAGTGIYGDRFQMPVEESGNMIIMLYAAVYFGADDSLAKESMPLLKKWVNYLDAYGDDPGEQLCTDDFAGHLAHNVNLSAKAMIGIACYAALLEHFGMPDAEKWNARAKEMAEYWLKRMNGKHPTPLTFDGTGWSMKYNLIWDKVLGFDLLPDRFYREETESYIPLCNRYGLPLDSRANYTKSDWICWTAAMADSETCRNLLSPVARYLLESRTRVAFSDWYDTLSGDYVEFIGRSVQGGVFMPLLIKQAIADPDKQ